MSGMFEQVFAVGFSGAGRLGWKRWLALVLAMLAGCATVADDRPDAVQDWKAIAGRDALARWELIIKGDSGQAYDRYMSEGSRKVLRRDDFIATMAKTQFRGADVETVECGAEACAVSVRITYDMGRFKGVGITVKENWIVENRQLRYVWTP